MKYKVGDKVKIVDKRVACMASSVGDIDEFLGTIMTIESISHKSYKMLEDDGCWCWNDSTIERLATSNDIIPKLQ